VEKSLPLLLTGTLIVPGRLVQRFQELFSAFPSCTPAKHLIKKHLHRFIVRDGKSVTMYHRKFLPLTAILHKPELISTTPVFVRLTGP